MSRDSDRKNINKINKVNNVNSEKLAFRVVFVQASNKCIMHVS